ncbi:MAG: lipopolysaccharide biosynthesis protein [Deltaproteobacteria bacterium]|nr:lipopolysaccharide biosynthesis protein [Deltaproteobacteria bacterium]
MIDRDQLSSKVLSGLSWSYCSAAIDAISRLAIISILAHLLTPRDFGIVGLAIIFTTFAERVGQFGIGPAVVQSEILTRRHIDSAVVISLITGLVMAGTLFMASYPIAGFFKEPILQPVTAVLALVFIFDAITQVPLCLLMRDMQFKQLMIVENGAYLLGSGAMGIALALSGFGVWALVFSHLGSRLIKLLLTLKMSRSGWSISIHKQEASQLFRTGVGFSLGRLLNFVALQGDNLVVGRFLGAAALGLYSRSYQLMTLPSTYIAQIIDRVLFPAMAQRQSNPAKLSAVLLVGIELIGLVSLPFSVFVLLFSREIISLLFGSHWIGAAGVLQVLSLGIFFRCAYKCGDTVLRALGAVFQHAGIQAAYAALVIGGCILGSRWGLTGITIAVLAAVFINYLLLSYRALQLLRLNVQQFLAAHLPGIWLSAALAAVLLPLQIWIRSVTSSDLVVLLTAASVSTAVLLAGSRAAPDGFKPIESAKLLGRLQRPYWLLRGAEFVTGMQMRAAERL